MKSMLEVNTMKRKSLHTKNPPRENYNPLGDFQSSNEKASNSIKEKLRQFSGKVYEFDKGKTILLSLNDASVFLYNQKILGVVVQYMASVLGDDYQVFYTYADIFLRNIDTGFYREALSNLDNLFINGGNVSHLVILDTCGMSGSMSEVLTIALLLDIVSASQIHIAHSVAGLCHGDSPKVGISYNLINLLMSFTDFSNEDGSGHVGDIVI